MNAPLTLAGRIAMGIHECAPGHSTETVTVETLRQIAEASEEMAEVLEVCAFALRERQIVRRLIEQTLKKARAE